MTVTLAGTNFLDNVVTDAQSQGGAKDRANWAAAIFGGHRGLAEFTDGVKYDESAAVPHTGMGGGPGHDHSGGRMGVPIQHTVFLGEFGTYPTPGTALRESAPSSSVSAGIPEVFLMKRGVWMFVPPGIAYLSMSITALVYATAACDLRIRASWFGHEVSFTTALAANSVPANPATLVTSHAQNVMLPDGVPGRFNELFVTVEAVRDAADATVALMSLGVHQVQSTP